MATNGSTVTLNPSRIMLSAPYTHYLQFSSTFMKNCYFKIPDNQGPYNIMFLSRLLGLLILLSKLRTQRRVINLLTLI